MRRTEPPAWPLILLAIATLPSCGPSGPTRPATDQVPIADASTAAHDDLLSRVYDTGYSVPDGFFVDERADTPHTYTVYHVKDHSVSYELCSDDYAEALAWEAADNASRAVNGHFVDAYENADYFEFIRELTYPSDVGNVQAETSVGFARVFKCSSVNRDGVDRNLRDGFGGVLTRRPLTAQSVRQLTEYLWQFEYFGAATRKVLDSYTTEDDQSIEHTLELAFLVKQGYDRCDRIEVFDWVFTAGKTEGRISRAFRFRYGIEARLEQGKAVPCQT